jgi:hypothetical protein
MMEATLDRLENFTMAYCCVMLGSMTTFTIHLNGQTEQEVSIFSDQASNGLQLNWQSVPDRAYFVQTSTDLIGWSYLPLIKLGTDGTMGLGFDSNAEKLFFRLKYSDALPYDEDPNEYDFDGDKISNLDELNKGTDPFSNQDLNGNGIPDDWELFHGITDASSDSDFDGLSALEEYQAGSSPKDYFNGILGNFTMITNENNVITMQVTSKDDGSPMLNAPVNFRATLGGHMLATSPEGTNRASELTVRAGADGKATVYAVAP